MRVALCQIASTSEPDHTLDLVRDGVRRAAGAGARLVVFPEAAMARFGSDLAALAQPLDGAWAAGVAGAARQAGVVVVAGMFTPAADGRVRNTMLVTGAGVHAGYDKVHLFDALGHHESATVEAGGSLLAVELDGVHVGVATCYDLRFPALFQALGRAGATIVVVGASWAAGPGKVEQWELLVRARALDTTAFVLACGQADPVAAGLAPLPRAAGGIGNSLAVSPLGEVRARLDGDPGVLIVEVDPAEVAPMRGDLPVLGHTRAWSADDVRIVSSTAVTG